MHPAILLSSLEVDCTLYIQIVIQHDRFPTGSQCGSCSHQGAYVKGQKPCVVIHVVHGEVHVVVVVGYICGNIFLFFLPALAAAAAAAAAVTIDQFFDDGGVRAI
jgi:hypothetical protein